MRTDFCKVFSEVFSGY